MFHGPWVFQRTSTSPLILAKLSKYEMNFTKKSVMLANLPMMCRGAENSHAGKGPGMPIRSTSQPQGEMLLAAHLESPLTTNHTLGAASSTTLRPHVRALLASRRCGSSGVGADPTPASHPAGCRRPWLPARR
jgi:hypothetical protein